jgi:hypothetical protein
MQHFPQSPNVGNACLSSTDWVDTTLAGWQTTVEPLAIGLSSAIGELLKQAGTGDGSPLGGDDPSRQKTCSFTSE